MRADMRQRDSISAKSSEYAAPNALIALVPTCPYDAVIGERLPGKLTDTDLAHAAAKPLRIEFPEDSWRSRVRAI